MNEVLGNHLKDSAWLAYACRGRFPVPDDCWQIPKVRTKYASKQPMRPAGLEPTTFGFGGRRSVQLSYGRESLGS